MASRRTRIKAIANITHRKKPTLSLKADPHESAPVEELKLPSNNFEVEENWSQIQPEIENNSIPHKEKCIELKEESIENAASQAKASNKIVVISENEIKRIPVRGTETCNLNVVVNKPPSSETCSSETILAETLLSANLDQPNCNVTVCSPAKRGISETPVSDTEYPGPPPSPSKFNRSRIRPVPRLGLRKPSASESEDESRRYGRIRNNSVSSVASTIYQEPQTPIHHSEQKDVPAPTPKKIFRNEQARKLAEARREFHKRFRSTTPDKKQLRMIDLIFYNPNSNPMSRKGENSNHSEINSEPAAEQVLTENNDPDAPESAKEKENDDDNSMPVPQIKIGPSGEIILDEQSVVMENTQVTKQKEQIRNSEIVDGDSTGTYGIYKRAARSLPWSQKETLRFYKALNLIGTDFTLMSNLFPTRNRRELKIKFKKEEKMNMPLVERAIREPCCYNFTDLKREIEIEREEEAILQKVKDDELRNKSKPEQTEKLIRKRKRKDLNSTSNESRPPAKRKPPTPKQKPIESPGERTPASIDSAASKDGDADVSDSMQSDTDEEEFIPFLKPTRFGRMPKSTLKFTEPVDRPVVPSMPRKRVDKKTISHKTFDSGSTSRLPASVLRNRRLSSTSSVESNPERLVPGAVIITSEEDPNGDQQYKVFMVTPEKKLAPVETDSDTIATLLTENSIAEMPFAPSLPENNCTIAATSVEVPANTIDTLAKEKSSMDMSAAVSRQEEGIAEDAGASVQENEASVEENEILVEENEDLVKDNQTLAEENADLVKENEELGTENDLLNKETEARILMTPSNEKMRLVLHRSPQRHVIMN